MEKKPKVQPVQRPVRDPDHYSKRQVPYWWAPEWTRGTHYEDSQEDAPEYDGQTYQKIKAIKEKDCAHKNPANCLCDWDASLYTVAKNGNLNFIQGSIQEEFKKWHADRQIDYILLGESKESATDLIISETEDTQYV